ncbi:MAG: YbaB/EbfC family nucleoid-associated protein [Pirellulaceae bacterium]|jgi:hypothetical protein|nr:YbaB/EbfC family nucleoid-associated protein [Pirellulaceae bacterium]
MFKGIGNLGSLWKSAQEMTGKMQELQDQLRAARITGSAGGGMVEIEANGLGEVLRVRLDPALVAAGDRDMLEDLLPAACNQVQAKARDLYRTSMQSLTEGLNLPGLSEALAQLTGRQG